MIWNSQQFTCFDCETVEIERTSSWHILLYSVCVRVIIVIMMIEMTACCLMIGIFKNIRNFNFYENFMYSLLYSNVHE